MDLFLASIGNSLVSILVSILNNGPEFFFIYVLQIFFLGVGMAFTHQYRFAAAESVEKNKATKSNFNNYY